MQVRKQQLELDMEQQTSCVGKIPGRRERLPALVFWPGEFRGLYSPWGRKEFDMTEQLSLLLTVFETDMGQISLIYKVLKQINKKIMTIFFKQTKNMNRKFTRKETNL